MPGLDEAALTRQWVKLSEDQREIGQFPRPVPVDVIDDLVERFAAGMSEGRLRQGIVGGDRYQGRSSAVA